MHRGRKRRELNVYFPSTRASPTKSVVDLSANHLSLIQIYELREVAARDALCLLLLEPEILSRTKVHCHDVQKPVRREVGRVGIAVHVWNIDKWGSAYSFMPISPEPSASTSLNLAMRLSLLKGSWMPVSLIMANAFRISLVSISPLESVSKRLNIL